MYEVTVYGSQDEYRKKTGQPDWSTSVVVGNVIYAYYSPALHGVLAHQMVHLIWREFMAGRLSDQQRWIDRSSRLRYVARPQRSFVNLLPTLRVVPMPFDQLQNMARTPSARTTRACGTRRPRAWSASWSNAAGASASDSSSARSRSIKASTRPFTRAFPGNGRGERRKRLEGESPMSVHADAGPIRRVVLPVRPGCTAPRAWLKVETALKAAWRECGRSAVDLPSRTVAVSFAPSDGRLDVKQHAPGHREGRLRRARGKRQHATRQAESKTSAFCLSRRSRAACCTRLRAAAALSRSAVVRGRQLNLSPYTAMLIAVPMQVWGGWHFHQGLSRSAAAPPRRGHGRARVSLSTWAAFFFHSSYVVLFPRDPSAGRAPLTQWDAVCGPRGVRDIRTLALRTRRPAARPTRPSSSSCAWRPRPRA